MSCDPNTLVEAAKCLQCLNPQESLAVEVYLLTQIAGVDPDPNALLAAAKDFQALTDRQLSEVQAYLLCQISGQ